MHSTTTSADDRRVARRRVGTAAIVAFLALLLAGAARSTAGTDPAPAASLRADAPDDDTTRAGVWSRA